jgi:putative transcriptional regulator
MGIEDDELAIRIAGQLVLSPSPGKEMKFLREKAGINQSAVAKEMGVSPSVLSDYENERRKSPGVGFIKRYVNALLKLDRQASRVLGQIPMEQPIDAILTIREFEMPVPAQKIIQLLNAEVLVGDHMLENPIYGYTVLDSIKTIYSLTGNEFYKIFGRTSERALIFTRVGLGRSPMVAVRVSHLKPRMVVVHGPLEVDPLAIKLAKVEGVILALSRLSSEGEIIHRMSTLP